MYKNSQNNNFNKTQETATITATTFRFFLLFNRPRIIRYSTNRTSSTVFFKPMIQTIGVNSCSTRTRSSKLY